MTTKSFAIIYDTGPEHDPCEEYYEIFSSPEEALRVWDSGMNVPTNRNPRLVEIIGTLDEVRNAS